MNEIQDLEGVQKDVLLRRTKKNEVTDHDLIPNETRSELSRTKGLKLGKI